MSLNVYEDIINGNSYGLTANGPVATRVFIVTASANETIVEAVNHPSIPVYYEQYPLTDTGSYPIYALDIQARTHESQKNVYEITVAYGRPDFQQQQPGTDPEDSLIQVGSSVTATKTQRDNTGAKINITLTGQPDQVGEVDLQVPETVVLFERKESESPLAKSIANTGRVNSVSLASGTYEVRTLLCLGIEGTSTDNGLTWQVTYRFQYRPDTWDATVVYIDPETDRPHEGIVFSPADGVEVVQVYPTADFSSLNLDW